MSSALAIASVTYVLKDLLNNGLVDHDISSVVGNVMVTALPPDRIDTTTANTQSQLNLFLYRVTPNPGWQNVGLPSRDGRGERVSNPPLALDLHYLLTPYGAGELHAEILLGYGMQLLHETSVLVRDAIRRSLAPPTTALGGGLPSALQDLHTSELAEQIEQIKVTPESLGTEEISKLWAAFQAKYRPSAAYQASVVLIESQKSTKSALPVRERKIYPMPFRQPVLDKIMSQAQTGDPIVEHQPILAGYKLVIAGKQLRADALLVNVGGIEVTPQTEDLSDTQIICPLPSALKAGVQGVQVVHQKLMGSPPIPHRGVESNIVAFVLRPRLDPAPTLLGTPTSEVIESVTYKTGELQVHFKPVVGSKQRVVLLLNEQTTNSPAYAYSVQAPLDNGIVSPATETAAVVFPFERVAAGDYLLRVQVDGAESPLGLNSVGKYDQPSVTI